MSGDGLAIGQDVEVLIDGYASEGEGVGRADGAVIFIPETVRGERVRVRIAEQKKNYFRAFLLQTLEPSAQRLRPPCPLFDRCGGCRLQHLAYGEQLFLKEQRVRDAVRRIGGVAAPQIRPVRGMEHPWRYRNKLTFTVTVEDGSVRPAFYHINQRDRVVVTDCLIAPARMSRVAGEAVRLAFPDGPPPEEKGLPQKLVLTASFHSGELIVTYQTADKELAGGRAIAERLRAACPDVAGVVNMVTPSGRTTPVREILLAGIPSIEEQIGAIFFTLSAGSFFQVNPAQARVLYETALAMTRDVSPLRVLDAYSGVGGFALFFAPRAESVTGVESLTQAVRDAEHNARRNGFGNARFLTVDLETPSGRARIDLSGFTLCVADPPRRGLPSSLISSLGAAGVGTVLYASCDPGTLARDIKRFMESGFRVVEILPLDMFPQTAHVECLCLLVRESSNKKNH